MKEIKTTLVIMAAGIGSRFGKGIKQLEKIGPGGEILMDYSIYDAKEAGFQKVVFIIRKDLEKDFKEIIGNRIAGKIEVEYVFQELDDLPEGFLVPAGRTKPWGTGQAILCCKDVVKEPFAIINADDYYGKSAFKKIHDYLVSEHAPQEALNLCMAGFILKNTLSENGTVTRGVCTTDEENYLTEIVETHGIRKSEDGTIEREEEVEVTLDSKVSMNMWGAYPEFIGQLETGFKEFLTELTSGETSGGVRQEFLLPVYIDHLLKEKKATVKLLETKDKWFGITYLEDKDSVVEQINQLVSAGAYEGI